MTRLNIIRCDRCNDECRPGGATEITVPNQGHDYHDEKLDLCTSCFGQLKAFLNNKDVGKKGTTFEEFRIPCPHHVPCGDNCQGTALKRVYLKQPKP